MPSVGGYERTAVVVATVFGPDGEEICDFDSRALHGADSAYENILFFASTGRSRRTQIPSRSRRCLETRAAGNLF
jgi:hypothetical protein